MKALVALVLMASTALPASAAVVWTDWTQATANTAVGTLNGIAVTVASSTNFNFTQTNGGTDYWTPWFDPALRPTGTDIISLAAAGTRTISFSAPVSGLLLAVNSWNVNGTTTFNAPFSVVGQGQGYWGNGTFQNVTATSFFSGPSNEIHGILRFDGPISSLTFTDPFENWHGFTLGVEGETTAGGVPEPSSWAMLISGFGLVGGALRRRRSVVAA